MRTFLLQILPFLTSILIGTILFIIEEHHISHEGLSSLIMGIASGLFGIPIVFIFYQMASNYSERKIRKVIANHLIFEMNYIIIRFLKDLKGILDFAPELTKDNLYIFLIENKELEGKKLHFKKDHAQKFQKYKAQILQIAYSNPKLDVLSETVMHNILSIAKELGIISAELEAKNKNRETVIHASLETLVFEIDQWIEFCELEAVVSHHSFTFV